MNAFALAKSDLQTAMDREKDLAAQLQAAQLVRHEATKAVPALGHWALNDLRDELREMLALCRIWVVIVEFDSSSGSPAISHGLTFEQAKELADKQSSMNGRTPTIVFELGYEYGKK